MPNTVQFNEDYPDISQSEALYGRSQTLIPAHSQTLAKGPTQYVKGVAPIYLQRGAGARVWDVDGNEYLDYNMGIGPVSLGYAWPAVDEAIKQQLADGISFSLTHPLEVEFAEKMRQILPNAQSVRTSKTGAEVTSAAIRVARAYTGREKVLCCGYHGWHDWYIGVTARDAGVPTAVKELVHTFNYNDIDSVMDALDEDTACVILEPMTFDFPKDDFLHRLKGACEGNDTLLIFDEMWTGFRWALGGAQTYFDVTPDLACYSKAIANGMPLSVITGRQDVMDLFDEEVFFFSTFGGETLSLAAALATIAEMEQHDVPAHLAKQGEKLLQGYNEIAQRLDMPYTSCKGHPARSLVTFAAEAGDPLHMKSLVQQEMIKRGVLWSGFHNMCFSHADEDIAYTLAVYEDVLPILKTAVSNNNMRDLINGRPVQPVFRKTTGFHTKPKVAVNGGIRN